MFPFVPASKLMTTMGTSTVTLANVLVQWPFVVASPGLFASPLGCPLPGIRIQCLRVQCQATFRPP